MTQLDPMILLVAAMLMFAVMLFGFFYVCLRALRTNPPAAFPAPQVMHDLWISLDSLRIEMTSHLVRINSAMVLIEDKLKGAEVELASIKALLAGATNINPMAAGRGGLGGHGGLGEAGTSLKVVPEGSDRRV